MKANGAAAGQPFQADTEVRVDSDLGCQSNPLAHKSTGTGVLAGCRNSTLKSALPSGSKA
jgi:hypothetical protein